MKTPLFLAVIAITSTGSMAQPVLTETDFGVPQASNIYVSHTLPSNYAQEGPATWDVSDSDLGEFLGTSQTVDISALTQSNISDFPTANYCESNANNLYYLFEINPSQYKVVARGDNSTFTSYPSLVFDLPYKYGHHRDISSTPINTTYTDYDAYGTLILPFGTYFDVVRVKEEYTSTMEPGYTRYYWYATNPYRLLYSIAIYCCVSPNIGFFVPTALSTEQTGTDKPVIIYPNPFNEEIKIAGIKEKHVQGVVLSIYDLTGRKVKNTLLNRGQTSVETASLVSGVYMVVISDSENEMVRKKLVKR